MRLAELDSSHAVFTDDAAPKHVVAVEDQALLVLPFERANVAEELVGELLEPCPRVRSAREVPVAGIVELARAKSSDAWIRIDEVSARLGRQCVANEVVQLRDQGRLAVGPLSIGNPIGRVEGGLEPDP